MLKFQTPMSNDEVCRAMTDKQTHKQTYILSKKIYQSVIILLKPLPCLGCAMIYARDTSINHRHFGI